MNYSGHALSTAYATLGKASKEARVAMIEEARRIVAMPVCDAGKRAQAQALLVAHGLAQN